MGEIQIVQCCSRCKRYKPLWAFDGMRTCRPCRVGVNTYSKRRYAANPEHYIEKSRSWVAANHKRHSDNAKRQHSADPEKFRAAARRWRVANPERARENGKRSARTRRARKRNATIGGIPRDAEEQLLGFQNYRCAYCHEPLVEYHVDHVVPLARGGAHAWDNVVLACPACNKSKATKLVAEWRIFPID